MIGMFCGKGKKGLLPKKSKSLRGVFYPLSGRGVQRSTKFHKESVILRVFVFLTYEFCYYTKITKEHKVSRRGVVNFSLNLLISEVLKSSAPPRLVSW